MAVSGSFNHSMSRTNLIEAALRKIDVLAEGQSASTNQLTYGAEALNNILKAWMSDDFAVWYHKLVYVYPIASTQTSKILLGPTGGNASLELGLTKLTAAAAATDTALTVSITAAIDVVGTTADADVIGIELDDGTIDWTTISSGGGTASLVIASGLSSAAASGNRVYFYTTILPARPERILDAWWVDAVSAARRPLQIKSESTLRSLGNLTTEGQIVEVNYIPTLTDGTLTVWPRWEDGSSYLEIRCQYPFDDMDAASDTLAFPQHWYMAVVYALAQALAPEYGTDLQKWSIIKQEAKEWKDLAEEGSTEGTSVTVSPETR